MIYADPKSLPPIISIDVSKGKANAIEVLYPTDLDGKKKPTVHVFSYDKDGLGELSTMYDDVMRIRNDGVVPVIVMEHTGIYTAPIIRYCEKHGYDFVMLHPSMSNEARQNVMETFEGLHRMHFPSVRKHPLAHRSVMVIKADGDVSAVQIVILGRFHAFILEVLFFLTLE